MVKMMNKEDNYDTYGVIRLVEHWGNSRESDEEEIRRNNEGLNEEKEICHKERT